MIAGVALALAACGSTTSSEGTTTTSPEPVAQQRHESLTHPSLTVVNPASSTAVTATTAILPESSKDRGTGGWLAVGTKSGSHLGMVLGTAPIEEGKNSNVVIKLNPALAPGAYVVGLFHTHAVPTPSDTPLTTQSVTVAGS